MTSRYAAYRHGSDTVPPDVVDRILVGACAAVWLVLIGVSVAATVALANLGQGYHKSAGSSHTPWVLYAVIIVSAVIIAGAIPVLVRARRMSRNEPPAQLAGASARGAARQLVRTGHPAARPAADRARSRGEDCPHFPRRPKGCVYGMWHRLARIGRAPRSAGPSRDAEPMKKSAVRGIKTDAERRIAGAARSAVRALRPPVDGSLDSV